MKHKLFVYISMLFVLGGCYLSPGMKFSEGTNRSVDGTTKTVNAGGLQYHLRVVPISKKVLYLQNISKNNLRAVANSNAGLASSIYDASYSYRIRAHDILGITLWESTDAVAPALEATDFGQGLTGRVGQGLAGRAQGAQRGSQETVVVVDSEGYIYYPFAGEVYVKNLTASEIRRKMQSAMKEYFDDPKVSVRVSEHNSQFVMVTGQVQKPGRIPVVSQVMTVIDAINESGGMKQEGSWKRATLSRANGQKINIDLQRMYTKGDLAQNHVLRHGDILHVPQIEGSTAYLYSDGAAKPMLLQNNTVSLTEAIGNTGGISSQAANAKQVFVLRREEGRPFEEVTAYHLNARSPAALVLANSFYLKPKDIVYIETDNIVRWNRVVSLLLPSTSAINATSNLSNVGDKQ